MSSEENCGISDPKLKSIFTFLLVESLRIDGFNGSIASIERVRIRVLQETMPGTAGIMPNTAGTMAGT